MSNVKLAASIISVILGLLAFYPYLRDVFSRKTQPHLYTWIIWTLTQGTATIALWRGGGGFGVINLMIGTFLVLAICIFSFKYGTKNITRFDLIVLICALFAILVWWLFQQPVFSVIMISVIDILGYLPSYRKSWKEPYSETVITWMGFFIGNIFTIIAINEYNFLTLTYIISISLANLTLALICLIRRTQIKK